MRSRALTGPLARRGGRAQVCAPLGVAAADRGGERLAVRVRARETAEIGAVALADARDEKAHRFLRRLRLRRLCGLLLSKCGAAERAERERH